MNKRFWSDAISCIDEDVLTRYFEKKASISPSWGKNTASKGGVNMLSNKVYDVLKYITTIVLPALGTLYFALASIWGFPYGEQIVGTITAIVTFLGVCLGVSTSKYNKAVR